MAFDWLNVSTPFSWSFGAALFLAAGFARVSRPHLGPERWTWALIYFAVAVALAAGAVFVPGPPKILDLRLAYFAGSSLVVAFLALRFKVSVGLPLLVVVAALVTLLGLSLRGWTPLEGSSESIAQVQVLDAGAHETALEITPSFGESAQSPVSGTVPAGALLPVVTTLQFSPSYFFLASPILFRLDGVESGGHGSIRLPVSKGPGALLTLVSRLPGIALRVVVGQRIEGATLQRYSIMLTNRLTVSMTPVTS